VDQLFPASLFICCLVFDVQPADNYRWAYLVFYPGQFKTAQNRRRINIYKSILQNLESQYGVDVTARFLK
jgi:hypothetical protein